MTMQKEAYYERAKRLGNHGLTDRNTVVEFGFVSRMDAPQATIPRQRMKHLPDLIRRRRTIFEPYRKLPDPKHAFIPSCKRHEINTWVPLIGQFDRRGALQEHCRKHAIGMAIHYPVPAHLQPAAKRLGHKGGGFPVVERHADRTLSLRHQQKLTEESRSAMLRTKSTASTARERQIKGES